MYGLEVLHPLVAVVDLPKATHFPARVVLNFGVYALYLKQTKCGDLCYGKQIYNYQEGTVTSFAPGQVVEKMAEGVRFWRPCEERNRKRCKICKWGKYICNWGCGKMKIIL